MIRSEQPIRSARPVCEYGILETVRSWFLMTPEADTTARNIAAEHGNRPDALVEILHQVQAALGHVPEAAIRALAEALNLSRAEVYGVVTFYHDFRTEPAGRHVLKICRAEACQSMGAEALVAHAEARLGVACGGTSADRHVTLQPVYCLGLCATAPSAMMDDEVIGRLTPGKLDSLLKGAGA
jgi:formate dehydrogenase subunit gamma